MAEKKRYVPVGNCVVDKKVGGGIIQARTHAHASAICKGLNAYEYAVYTLTVLANHPEIGGPCKVIAKDALAEIMRVIQ